MLSFFLPVDPLLPLIIFIRFPPLIVIFCIWLLITTIKLIKKSSVAFSEGKTEQGRRLLLAGIFLPVGIVLVAFLFILFIGTIG